MKFVQPYFLFALFSLAIPLIIHLFNFRRFKRVHFTNVRFLREVKQETQSRNKLKHLLVLLARCLALSFLVFAFAQPFIPLDDRKVVAGDKAISIFVDNSFSMDAVNTSNTALLKEAKDAAAEIAAAYKPTDRFQLLTNDFEGRHQRFVNREEFLELLDEVQLSPAVRTVSEITSRQQDILSNADGIRSQNKLAFIISDFQKTISDFEKIKSDTSVHVTLVRMEAQNRNNVYIDSCWFESPVRLIDQNEVLHERLRSRSDNALENVPMTLYINGDPKTLASFSIGANGQTDTVANFKVSKAGLQQGYIEIKDYPVTFDDRFYFAFEVLPYIPVLSINPARPATVPMGDAADKSYVDSLFGRDSSTFRYTSLEESKIDYAALPSNRFIVLNQLKNISSGLGQELKKFVQNGGSVFVFPAPDSDLPSYREFLAGMNSNTFEAFDTTRQRVDKINYDHPLYQGVFERRSGNIDLPAVRGHFRLSKNVRTTQDELMRLRNGDIFAASTTFGKGKLYICTAPLDFRYSSFGEHAVFVPTMYQAALFSQPQRKLFYTIGRSESIDLPGVKANAENVFHLVEPKRNFDIIPAHRVNEAGVSIDVQNQVREPGNYFIDAGKEHIAAVAFNHDRKESDLSVLSKDDLASAAGGLKNFAVADAGVKGLAASITEIDQGKRLWKWCVWLALLFLLAEVLLLRLWKTEKTKPQTQTA